MLDRLREARIFTKLDISNANHVIRIKEGDEYNTAFRTRFGQFQYQVIPFWLTNALATFHAYMDDYLQSYIDDFAVCYLDDILIYLTNQEEHEEQVRKVLEQLREFCLYQKSKMCRVGVSEFSILWLAISPDGSAMESDRISTIEEWTTPESVRDVQVLLEFTHFYWRFIRKYAKVTTPKSYLLKKAEICRRSKQIKWEWTRDSELTFRKLRRAFTDALIVKHLELAELIILQTNACGFAIPGILNQYDVFGILRPVNFYCWNF